MCFVSMMSSLCGSSAWGGGQSNFISNFNSFKNSYFGGNSFKGGWGQGGGGGFCGNYGNYGGGYGGGFGGGYGNYGGGYGGGSACYTHQGGGGNYGGNYGGGYGGKYGNYGGGYGGGQGNYGNYGGGYGNNYSNYGNYGGGQSRFSGWCPPSPPSCPPTTPPEKPDCGCSKPPEKPECPEKPKECPPEPMDPIKVTQGKIWGDPHFVGADGGKYDVQGEAGKSYNLLSDKGVQVNGRFDAWGNMTVVGEVGITAKNEDGTTSKIAIDKTGKLTIDGESVTANGTHGNVTKDGGTYTVKAGEYNIKVETKGSYINMYFTSDNAVADNVQPHGLWGNTVDGDGQARNGDVGAGTQGGGAIEKADGTLTARGDKTTVKAYEVGGLFDTQFDGYTNKYDGGAQNAQHNWA